MSDQLLFVTLAFFAGAYLAVWVCGLITKAHVFRLTEEYELKLARAGLLLRRAQIRQEDSE